MTREEFALNFMKYFTHGVPEKQLKKYRIGTGKKDFLWNLFAADLVPCYVGDAARMEYDKVNKLCVEEIQYDNGLFVSSGDEDSAKLSDCHMTSADIDKAGLIEFYVFDNNFSWIYVITHEMDLCGPYFCYRPTVS